MNEAAPAGELTVRDLTVEIAGRALVSGLSFGAQAGQFVAVLGENGVGKTLTMHTLAGLRAPASGEVRWRGRPLADWPRRALAQQIGLVAQSSEDPFPATVLETALIGRHPHLDFWQWEDERDYELARAALVAVDLSEREARAVDSLSGGERRRLAIATVLAQDPAVFLLDEPTNHLDPHHQLEALKLFRTRADAGRLVIATLHDATQAARFADRVLLLHGDGSWTYGSGAEALTAANLSRLYRTRVQEIDYFGRRVFLTD